MIRCLALVVLAAALTGAELAVEQPWARATAPSAANGAVFAVLSNPGSSELRITAASSTVAQQVELHGHRPTERGVEMYRLDAMVVPAGGQTELKPGGMHIMLMGLKAPLVEGTTIELQLTVEGESAPINVAVPVLGIAAMGPDASCCDP